MKYFASTLFIAFISAVMAFNFNAAASTINPNEENTFVKRGVPSDHCFNEDRKLPCVWITAEKKQHYDIKIVDPNTMVCDQTKGGGSLCEISSVNSDVTFACTGPKHSLLKPAGATIHFTDGQVSFTNKIGDQDLWSYTINQAGNTAIGTAEISCGFFTK